MRIPKLMIGLVLSACLPMQVFSAVGVSSFELIQSANIVLPSGASLTQLPGYNAFTLESQYSLEGGVVAKYEADLSSNPWDESETVSLKLMSFVYPTQDAAHQEYEKLSRQMKDLNEELDSNEVSIYFLSQPNGQEDAFNSVDGAYDSMHYLHVNGNLLYQVSLYKVERSFNPENLTTYKDMMANQTLIQDLLYGSVQSMKLALALLFPPSGSEYEIRNESFSENLHATKALPLNGSIAFKLYLGEISGAVGTILDSSGIGAAQEGDLYLYIHNDGRLFAGIYAPNYDADCTQNAGWFRLQSSTPLHSYEWNQVELNYGVKGFNLELNGITLSCAVSQPRSDRTLYLGDVPNDGVNQSMLGDIDALKISASTSHAGLLWDDILDQQLFGDVDMLDPDIAVFEAMKEAGVFLGTEGNLFPDETLNRAQMMKVILKAYLRKLSTETSSGFPDVPGDAWYAPYVVTAKKIGMVEGNADGSFAPAATINRAEFYTMLMRIEDFKSKSSVRFKDVDSSDWYANAALFAQEYGLVNGKNFAPALSVTRREAAKALYRLRYE